MSAITNGHKQTGTALAELGRPVPRTFGEVARRRFFRDRLRRYLTDIPGDEPTTQQAARIETMVRLEGMR
jgi:hypothetical protein